MQKDLLYTLWDGTKIFVVNGNEVRDRYDEDFLEGGHGLVYEFIPEHEIWITSDVIENDETELLAHEMFEWYQMKYEDKNYEKAHGLSEKFEEALRMVDNVSKEFKAGGNMKFSGVNSIDELTKKALDTVENTREQHRYDFPPKAQEEKFYQDLKFNPKDTITRPDQQFVTTLPTESIEPQASEVNTTMTDNDQIDRYDQNDKTSFVGMDSLDELIKTAKEESIEDKIITYIMENPNPSDKSGVHVFAESLGMDPDKLEEKIYGILTDILTGGKSKGKMPEDADPEEIRMGMTVEAEHVSNPALRRKIVADHLTDNPKYYSEGKAKGIFDELK